MRMWWTPRPSPRPPNSIRASTGPPTASVAEEVGAALSSGVCAGANRREAVCFSQQAVDDHGGGGGARGDRVRHGRHLRAHVAGGGESGHAGVERWVDLDGVDGDAALAG